MQKLKNNSIKILLAFVLSILILFAIDKLNINVGWLPIICILALAIIFCCAIANLILITIYKSELESKILAFILSLIPIIVSIYYFSVFLSIQC